MQTTQLQRPAVHASGNGTPSMAAIVQDTYGTSEVLHFGEIERPTIGDDEVLVKVRAAGIDRGTEHLMTGMPYLIRLLGYGFRRPKNPVPGLDVSGTVVEVGATVTRFGVGDEVFGIAKGSLAEYAAAKESKLALKPLALTFEQAAVVPVSSLTAIQGLLEVGRVQAGQRVLIVGASGGVGSYATQLAKALGAEVTGVASTSKLDLVRLLGADHVVDYTQQDFADGSVHYDLVLDIGGNTKISRLRRALEPRGTLVIVGGEDGGKWTGGIHRQLGAMLLSLFVKQRLTTFVSDENHVHLERVVEYIESGQVIPHIDRTYPLADAREAMHRLETGQARGKIAITN